jgi:cytochrome c oxidase subunit II
MTRRLLPLLLPAAAGCSGRQSALDPAGVQAGRIGDLYWLYFAVCLVVYLIVMTFVLVGFSRRHQPDPALAAPDTNPPAPGERRKAQWVWGATAATVAILFVLLVGDFVTGRGIQSLSGPEPLSISVNAHQWWWDVRYNDPDPSQLMTTANEIHVPVGRTVAIDLNSTDVIHSFWVPNLHGKKDAIPGHPTRTVLRADRPGTYWGQCAEFCGLQHANMRFVVVAESDADFHAWLDNQKKPAREPTTEGQKKGREVFLHSTCMMCHTIQGTTAQAKVGPDLTHVASRSRIAAGTLPTTRGHLAGWVSDPHGVKPGVRMTPNPLTPDELHSLLDYLESLQ